MQITCVVGLPGSGKTHHIWHNLTDADVMVDDPQVFVANWGCQNLKNVRMLWIADPMFCIPQVRAQAEQKLMHHLGVAPMWIFFENDPEACMQNVLRRLDGRKVRGLIHALTSRYQIPEGTQVLPMWRPETK